MSAPAAAWFRRDGVTLTLVVSAAALFLLPFVGRGWIPADVGHLGQSAARILGGELPHRDFDDTYTGGLAFLHAAAFQVAGIDALTLRWLLYLAQLLALVPAYALARRAASPRVAAAVTGLGLLWGVPLYFEAMPSWFNLFLALAATECLLRGGEGGAAKDGDAKNGATNGRARWRFLAGVCAGASIAIKSVGVLLVAAALLYLVYLDQERRTPADGRRRRWGGSVVVTLGLAAFLASVVGFVSQWPTVMNWLHFSLPGAALVVFLLWREWRGPSDTVLRRLRGLVALAAPFLLGAVLPLLLLAVPYVLQGALTNLLDPAILFPTGRVARAYHALPYQTTLICLVPIALVFALAFFPARTRRLDRRLALPALLGVVLLLAFGSEPRVYQLVWFAARPLVPLLAVAGLLLLARGRTPPERAHEVFLVLAVTSLSSLVQFPQSMGLYFAYVAPLVALAYLHVARAVEPTPWRLHAIVGVLFAGYGLLWIVPSGPLDHGIRARPVGELAPLGLERADLRVTPSDRDVYVALVATIQENAPPGSCIWAGPDAPQVYFLADRCNPTRTLWDIFDADYGTPDRTRRLLRLLAERDVPVAVVHLAPAFSRPPDGLAEGLARRYRRSARLREFVIFWDPPIFRDPLGAPTPPAPAPPAASSRTVDAASRSSDSPGD